MAVQPIRRFSVRSAARYFPLVVSGFVASVATGACGSDRGGVYGDRGADGGDTVPDEDVDRPQNDEIAVDEAALAGRLDGGLLHVDIPVEAVAGAAEGKLSVSIRAVDGSKTIATTSVSYKLGPNEKSALTASLKAPTDIGEQPDLVPYSLRIDDGSAQGLRVTSSLMRVVTPYDVRLEGPKRVSQDKEISYRIRAQHALTRQPISGLDVELALEAQDKQVRRMTATTGESGDAVFAVAVEDPGSLKVSAQAAAYGIHAAVGDDIEVSPPDRRVLLTTDKPLYQPGQTIYLRALALNRPGNTPLDGESVVFEVEDGKGNKILKEERDTDEYGIAATKFKIGNIVNQGTFKVRVITGQATTEKTVDVRRYALPKFDVAVDVDRSWYRAGDTVTGAVDARYFFGKDVEGADVTVEAFSVDVGETVFQQIMGKTDATGQMSFSLSLPSSLVGLPLDQGKALVGLRVSVTDAAGQVVDKEKALTIAASALDVSVVPEATTVVPGVENRIHVYVTDPLGAPIENARVTAQVDGEKLDATTSAYGHAEILWTPPAGSAQTTFDVTVTPESGGKTSQSFTFGAQSGQEHVIVRTDQSVYEIGDSVAVEVRASANETVAYVDWLNEGQAVNMRTVELTDGSATFTMPLDTTLAGSNRVEAYVVDDGGNLVRAGRTIFVRTDAALEVSLDTDKATYAPGETAELTFNVVDEAGEPTVAALGVQIVDEAVFSLIDARPGLLKTYFELEDEYATPQYQIKGPTASLPDLLFNETADGDPDRARAAQLTTEGALAALGGTSVTGIQLGSWAKAVEKATVRLSPYYDDAKKSITRRLVPVVEDAARSLEAEGCAATDTYCDALGTSYYEALKERATTAFGAVDFWGNAYEKQTAEWDEVLRLSTRGPDEMKGTGDDHVLSITPNDVNIAFGDLGHSADAGAGFPMGGFPEGDFGGGPAGGSTGGTGGGLLNGGGGAAGEGGSGESGPRIRQDFPETLYVNPAVITGPDGKARIDVDMADSITEWRVSTLAHSPGGKLGGGAGAVRVFQDFFVDVDFPATLTRGDEIEFPIAVFNYLDAPQTVELSLTPASWYTALGATTLSVDLDAGEVTGVRFPVRVDEVGMQKLTVTGLGTDESDAVARTVLVEPDGKEAAVAYSGSLAPGSASHTVSFPADAVPGSPQLYVNVYPAFLAQVVEGMDSMLQVPSGCFEQTTSTTWPNVLVTDYMQQTGQITPEIQLKAESLISAGYQRLLTFEHPGGGFSWFGTQDPAPFLSVTAFGTMEFADMSQVRTVDAAMLDRTRTWLAGQQKPDGSWEGDQSEFFSFHTSTVRNTAFVVWALASAGHTGGEIARGLDYVKTNLATDEDAYTLGIAANAFVAAAPNDPQTRRLLDDLESMKQADGDAVHWDSSGTQTAFYEGGNSASVATTAIVTHAMLLDGGYPSTVDGALTYLTASKDPNGNFGSTQATVWTLRALLLAATKGTEGAVGSLEIGVDGAPFKTLDLTADQSDVMTTVDLTSLASPGDHQVELVFVGTGKVSYNLVGKHHIPWADVPVEPSGPLTVDVAYDKTSLRVNQTVTATVSVKNNTTADQRMILVTAGLPPGFTVSTDDLDQYKESGKLSSYEVTEKQITLYLTELGASTTESFSYRLAATMPIKAADGGAEAFLYYEPEKRTKVPARMIEVLDN